MSDTGVSQAVLSMLKVDTMNKVSIVSTNGVLAKQDLSSTSELTEYRDLISVEYNATDNTLYFLFDNGDIIDVSMTPLSAFGKGPVGKRGADGKKGLDGRPGRKGKDGERGCPGMPGVAGKTGVVGDRGPKGQTGDKGPKGSRGPTGLAGPKGYRGYPNTDPNDPCATWVDPLSIGAKGENGIDGLDAVHLSFCREDAPVTNICTNLVWGQVFYPIPEIVLCPEPEEPCVQRATTTCPPLLTDCIIPETTTTAEVTTTTTTPPPPGCKGDCGDSIVTGSSGGTCTSSDRYVTFSPAASFIGSNMKLRITFTRKSGDGDFTTSGNCYINAEYMGQNLIPLGTGVITGDVATIESSVFLYTGGQGVYPSPGPTYPLQCVAVAVNCIVFSPSPPYCPYGTLKVECLPA